jgi:hypothetical protein
MAAMPGSQIYRNVANTYRVAVDDVIARERAELGLPVANSLRAWCGPQETLITAASESDAWEKALDLFPPAEGYRVESVRLA